MDHTPLIDHSCGFCVEIHDMDTDNNLFKRVIAPETGLTSRYVYEDDTFVVMPTLGAFVEGYVMIVSKEHHDCVGKMSAEDIAHLEALMEKITHRIREVYGTGVICFEHGAFRSQSICKHAGLILCKALQCSAMVDMLMSDEYRINILWR